MISILKPAAILAGAAGITYALTTGPAASLVRSGAPEMLSWVNAQIACRFDAVLCLQWHEADLRKIAKRAADQGYALLSERDRRSAELKAAETAVSDNARLLSEARDRYRQCSMNGQPVDWKGARYSPAEFKAQVQLLWEEKAILEQTRDRHRRFSEQLEKDLKANGTLRTQLDAELSLMPARIDEARREALRSDFHRVLGEINQIEGSADRQIRDTNLKLRTTSELIKAEPPKGEAAESLKTLRNPDFENFLNGAPQS
jgi:hypothetical protein